MRPLQLLFLFLLFPLAGLHAQDLNGYAQSNYAGITGAAYNPASLADHNCSFDLQLFGFSVEAGNNYVGVTRASLMQPDFSNQDLLLRNFNTKKSAFVRNTILLPGMMRSDQQKGWGIDAKVRTYVNVDGVEKPLAHTLVFELDDPPYYAQSMHNSHIGITAMSWLEIGGTYAKTLRVGAERFFAAGVRPKLLWGIGAAYAFVNDAGYIFYNDSTLSIDAAKVQFAHSDNFRFSSSMQPSYRLRFNPGLGVDAGVVYEYRPANLQQQKGTFNAWPGFRERPVYQYRIGVTLTDLGAIFFRSGEFSDRYAVDATTWDIDDKAFDSTSPATLRNTFDLRTGGSREGKAFLMRLPLALNIDYDQRLAKNIYVNADLFTALYLRNANGKRVHELTRLSVTPRYESRWFGFWMPLTVSRLGNFSVGSGVRMGPLIIGTNDILAWMLPDKKIYSADLYVVLKLPLVPFGTGGKSGKTRSSNGHVDDCAK